MGNRQEQKPESKRLIWLIIGKLATVVFFVICIYAGVVYALDKQPIATVTREPVRLIVPSSEIVRYGMSSDTTASPETPPSSAQMILTDQDTQDRLDRYERTVAQNATVETMTTPESVIETPESGVDFYRIAEHVGDDGVRRAEIIPAPDETASGNGAEPISQEERVMIAKTIWGEARGCARDEQKLVAWTILNRYDTGEWGDTVAYIITAPLQFIGYKAGHPVTDEIMAVANEVIDAWLNSEDALILPPYSTDSDYVFFNGDGVNNYFR